MNISPMEDPKRKFEKSNMQLGITPIFERGKIYGITGTAKTALLPLLYGITPLPARCILLDGYGVSRVDEYTRQGYSGFLFQDYSLLPHLTATENIMLSMEPCSYSLRGRAERLLARAGIRQPTAGRFVLKLSKSEQHRVAVARALSLDPQILMVGMDSETGASEELLDLFFQLAHKENRCVILMTQALPAIRKMDEVWSIKSLGCKIA